MTILALDLATNLGWALWRTGMEKPRSGAILLRGAGLGHRFTAYRDWLLETCIAGGVTHIVREAPFLDMKSANVVLTLYGLAAITEEVAARKGMTCRDIESASWRKFFIGCGAAPRTVAKKNRREWLKRQVIAECQTRGLDPRNDNEGDAIGILMFERARLYPEFAAQGALGL